jgi:hypothetical protein
MLMHLLISLELCADHIGFFVVVKMIFSKTVTTKNYLLLINSMTKILSLCHCSEGVSQLFLLSRKITLKVGLKVYSKRSPLHKNVIDCVVYLTG